VSDTFAYRSARKKPVSRVRVSTSLKRRKKERKEDKDDEGKQDGGIKLVKASLEFVHALL